MDAIGQPGNTPPPPSGDGGVRVQAQGGALARLRFGLYLGAAAALLGAAVWALLPAAAPSPSLPPAVASAVAPVSAPPAARAPEVAAVPPIARRAQAARPEPIEEPPELASLDPDDIAAWVRPGDPEPTMREVIEALREAGIHEGLAAFNPPGTRPALEGLAVPEGFLLPPGYVRHHQVTDEGEALEPILMFSPDHTFVDARGNPIALPEDGVVPPELAPPGLPIRRVRIPQP